MQSELFPLRNKERMIRLKRTDSEDKHFRELVRQLDIDLRIRDGEEHSFFAQFNKNACDRARLDPHYQVIWRFIPDGGAIEPLHSPKELGGIVVGGSVITPARAVGYPAVGNATVSAQRFKPRLYMTIAALRFLDRLR